MPRYYLASMERWRERVQWKMCLRGMQLHLCFITRIYQYWKTYRACCIHARTHTITVYLLTWRLAAKDVCYLYSDWLTDIQTDRRTDGWTDGWILPNTYPHAHTQTLKLTVNKHPKCIEFYSHGWKVCSSYIIKWLYGLKFSHFIHTDVHIYITRLSRYTLTSTTTAKSLLNIVAKI